MIGHRTLVAKSEDALTNPYLIFERVKRLVDSVKYTGLVAVAGDCTKVRARLAYSTDFGGHVLGSILPFDECEVREYEDIRKIVDDMTDANVVTTQVRAILMKVSHLRQLVFQSNHNLWCRYYFHSFRLR